MPTVKYCAVETANLLAKKYAAFAGVPVEGSGAVEYADAYVNDLLDNGGFEETAKKLADGTFNIWYD